MSRRRDDDRSSRHYDDDRSSSSRHYEDDRSSRHGSQVGFRPDHDRRLREHEDQSGRNRFVDPTRRGREEEDQKVTKAKMIKQFQEQRMLEVESGLKEMRKHFEVYSFEGSTEEMGQPEQKQEEKKKKRSRSRSRSKSKSKSKSHKRDRSRDKEDEESRKRRKKEKKEKKERERREGKDGKEEKEKKKDKKDKDRDESKERRRERREREKEEGKEKKSEGDSSNRDADDAKLKRTEFLIRKRLDIRESGTVAKLDAKFMEHLSVMHPTSALHEICSRVGWRAPVMSLAFEVGPPMMRLHIYKCEVNGQTFMPTVAVPDLKDAKANAAWFALQEMGFIAKDPQNPL